MGQERHPGKPLAAVCAKVLREYLPLVHQEVGRLARRLPANVLRDDLVAAGVFGLVDSLRRNGGDEGGAFTWYARTRIRGAVFDELRAQDWLPRRARRAATSAQSATTRWGHVHAVVSYHDESALEEALQMAMQSDDPVEQIEARSLHRVLVRAIEQLPERERRIVGMHYFHGVKFKDIGAELGVSEPRISQLHARALGLLRGLMDKAA
jgi:RNA polymerase sigma factor for flagellar operon FliA